MIASLPRPLHLLPVSQKKRVREVRAVSIGIGFRCSNGIVLCADTQATRVDVKFSETKFGLIEGPPPKNETEQWILASCYAGNSDIRRRVLQEIAQVRGEISTLDRMKACIESVLASERKKNKADLDRLEMLFAFSISGACAFLRSQGQVLSDVDEFHCIGMGDSALIRCFRDVFAQHPRFMAVEQCLMLGIYMVDKARAFIEYVGGKTEAVVVWPLGCYRVLPETMIELRQKHLSAIENGFSTLMGALFHPVPEPIHTEKMIDSFSEKMKAIRGKIAMPSISGTSEREP